MTPDEKHAYARQFPVHVGVDTAKQFHVLVAQGTDARRAKPFKVLVSRAGFEATHAHLQSLFPQLTPAQMLVGLEFAGHHGFTFARLLADRGYPVVNVLPAHTNRSKELEDNSPLKTDARDAAQIAKLVSLGIFVRFPFLTRPYVELRLLDQMPSSVSSSPMWWSVRLWARKNSRCWKRKDGSGPRTRQSSPKRGPGQGFSLQAPGILGALYATHADSR
jgi:hypothetical protein